jgi:hypothetical protein
MQFPKYRVDLRVCRDFVRVEIEPNAPCQEDFVVADGVDAAADGLARERADVEVVDGDGTAADFDHAGEGEQERGFAAAGAADDGEFGAGRDGEG